MINYYNALRAGLIYTAILKKRSCYPELLLLSNEVFDVNKCCKAAQVLLNVYKCVLQSKLLR